jgi:hypothetical protein
MWRGYKISTGPLDLGLDDSTGISFRGMNYELGVVSAEMAFEGGYTFTPVASCCPD